MTDIIVTFTTFGVLFAALAVIMWIRAPERHDLRTLRRNERARKQLRRGK